MPSAETVGVGAAPAAPAADPAASFPYGVEPRVYASSCDGMTGDECAGESCCSSLLVPGGSFLMGCAPGGKDCYDDERPEHRVTVGDFRLDKYPAAAGRVARFLETLERGWRPTPGSGANRAVEARYHLPAGATGWQAEWDWDGEWDADRLEEVGMSFQTNWVFQDMCRATTGPLHEADPSQPMDCLTWFEAFAFCIWDGGRLPTEAEWEYAATGGNENRVHPWGNDPVDASRVADCSPKPCRNPLAGSRPAGAGRWGHLDLSAFSEWTFDYYSVKFYRRPAAWGTAPANLHPSRIRWVGGPPGRDFEEEQGFDLKDAVCTRQESFDQGRTVRGVPLATSRAGRVPCWIGGFRCAREP